MLIFKRKIEDRIKQNLFNGRAILIFGPRQSGKTTLSKKILSEFGEDSRYFNCELASVRKYFEMGRPELLRELVGNKKIVVLDEAQTIENIGKILKVYLDTYPGSQIIATGSSSFDLANKINEPLTGRSHEFTLYPISISEIKNSGISIKKEDLLDMMRLGMYPAVVSEKDTVKKEDILKNLATNYLYKDIYTFESIKNPTIFENLIKSLSFQIGSLVSVNELSKELGISRPTVNKYIKLLEQSYIIKVIRPFSRNQRNEIKKAFKVYFIDIGVRNAVIDDISSVHNRADKGAIFENFFVMEKLKDNSAESFPPNLMFWRNKFGAEIDLIEYKNSKVNAFECKWNLNNTADFNKFLKHYPDAKVETISPEYFLSDQ
jgi:hypothetical protein